MARNHARVHVGIWQDDDFLDLRPSVQRLYLFLLSQANLSHLGVLPLTLRRWVKKTSAYSLDDLEADLADLAEAGFVVVDEDSEELLIRSLLRNDGIYQQPNVLRAAISTAPSIQSPQVKRALLAEVDRLDLSVVSDAPAKRDGDPTTREVVVALLDDLREGIAVPPENPSPNPSGKGSGNPSGNPSPGVPGTPYAGAGARPLVLSPTPAPSSREGQSPAAPRDKTEPDGFAEFWSTYPRRAAKPNAIKAFRKATMRADLPTILAGARRYATEQTGTEPKYVAYPATWLNADRWADEPQRPTGRLLPLDDPDDVEEWRHG